MREPIERTIERAGVVCLHLDPAYAPGQAALRILATKSEAVRVARVAEAAGGVLPLVEDTRLVLLPPVVAAPPAAPGLSGPFAYLSALGDDSGAAARAALTARRVAAGQDLAITRLRLAILVLTTCRVGEALAIVRAWFAAGGQGPIPYPRAARFRPWAEAHGVVSVEGYMAGGPAAPAEASTQGVA